jgi:fatty-acyl-CoA synthase
LVLAVNTRFRSQEVADLLGRGRADWLAYRPGFKGIAFDAILNDVPAGALARVRGVFHAGEGARPEVPALAHAAAHRLQDLLRADADTHCADARSGDARSGDARSRDVCSGDVHSGDVHSGDVHSGDATSACPPRDASAAAISSIPPAAPNAGAICFTTSGTTSLPKFVLHDQLTLLRHGDQVARSYGYDRRTCILATAPFCGVFGFAALASALASGVPIVCDAVFDALQAADAVQRHRVTHSYLNNEALSRMLQAAPEHDFSSCRLFCFASFAPGLEDLPRLAGERGIPLAGLYGSSELIALVAVQPLTDTEHRYLPGGRIIYAEGRVRARDPASGRILPHGEPGEIEIKSPSLMLGYLDNEQATACAVDAEGYFRTGDLGCTVDERQFVFQARLGDSLRLSGFLVSPAEIEDFVMTLPGVRATPQAWQAACRQALAHYKAPVGFHVLDEFPSVESANSVKIQKTRLRDMAAEILNGGLPAARPQ